MEIGILKDWLSAVAIVVSLLGLLYTRVSARPRINEQHLKDVDAALLDHTQRIQTVESELKHLPNKDDVNDLKLGLAELRGTIGRLEESQGSVQRTVGRVETYLLKETK